MDSPAPVNAPLEHQEVTLDRLCGDWWIYQLRRGHRYATDDLLTAWVGTEACPTARRLLDLGSGVGSVGLMALWRLGPEAHLTSLEVQAVSVALMRRTVAQNHLGHRTTVIHADLRAPDALPSGSTYDLITANPPYLAPGSAIPSPHPQRAGARLELRGDIGDYCRLAARVLAPGGRFCFSFNARDPRPEAAIDAAGLVLRGRQPVIFREGSAPTIALYTCARKGTRVDRPPLLIRDRKGGRAPGYRAIRRALSIEE